MPLIDGWSSGFSSGFGAVGTAGLIQNIHIGLTGWVGLFAYAVGNRVVNSGNAYQCITAGTSASGAGPTTTASNITDGTVHWKWLSAVNFSSLSAAVASLPSTFTQPITWQFWNDGTITIPGATVPYLTLSGHTTTSTNNLTLTCAPGESFRDTLAGGSIALAFNTAAGVSFTLPSTTPGVPFNYFEIGDSFVVFDGLQIKDPNSASGCTILQVDIGAIGAQLRNCIFDGYAQGNGASIVYLNEQFVMANCLVVDRQPSIGGQTPITLRTTGIIVNSTLIAPNNPAATAAVVSNGTTSGGHIIRNTASFGYPSGAGQSSVAVANLVIDHCATSASQAGRTFTDGGGNLLNQSASTNFVSTTSDFRLKLGASCINAGVTDTTDIPLATDIVGVSRPQGAAWDIGAFELSALRLRGTGIGRGKSVMGQSVRTRGTAKSSGLGRLTIPAAFFSRGRALAQGGAAGTFTQSAQAIDPWSSDFSIDFGPLAGTMPTISSIGKAFGYGRGSPSVALAKAAKGIARAFGRGAPAAIAAKITMGSGRSSGLANGAFTQSSSQIVDPWSSDFSNDFGPLTGATPTVRSAGLGIGQGKAALSVLQAPAARGVGKSQGRSSLQPTSSLIAIGKARSWGAALIGSPAAMRANGRGTGRGRGGVLYTVLGYGAVGISRAFSRSVPLPKTALTAIGNGAAKGSALQGADTLMLGAYGAARGFGSSVRAALTSALLASSHGGGTGRGGIRGAQSVAAFAVGHASGVARAVLLAVLPNLGRGSGFGRASALFATRPQIVGSSKASGRAAAAYVVRLQAGVAVGQSSGRNAILARLSMAVAGLAQGAGKIGSGGIQHLVTTRGTASSSGRAKLLFAANLTSVSPGQALGLSRFTATRNLTSGGKGQSSATAVSRGLGNQPSRGAGVGFGSAKTVGLATVALGGIGIAISRSGAAVSLRAGLSTQGTSQSKGRLPVPIGGAALVASGVATAKATAGSFVFAPVALVAAGRAFSSGNSRTTVNTVLYGTGVGLSDGRCAAIASALMMASGRSRAAGRLSAAFAVGFQSRGYAESRGRLYASNIATALGQSSGSGYARISGYYNVTPGTVGPRLSTIGQLPYFDTMDLGDVDFFSWDWSARVSMLNDPIVSASVTAYPSDMPIGPVVVVGNIVQVRAGAAPTIETYALRCTVVLRSGRTLHWSAPVSVECF